MSHSIEQDRALSPMWYFERNYFALLAMFEETNLLESGRVQFELGSHPVELEVLEETRYTVLVKICQKFNATGSGLLANAVFTVRVYSDARLAEVISYQGQHRIGYKYPYPNDGKFAPDEKRQCNLVLYDWLNACTRLNYKETITENC